MPVTNLIKKSLSTKADFETFFAKNEVIGSVRGESDRARKPKSYPCVVVAVINYGGRGNPNWISSSEYVYIYEQDLPRTVNIP